MIIVMLKGIFWLECKEDTGGEAKVNIEDKLEGGCEGPGET